MAILRLKILRKNNYTGSLKGGKLQQREEATCVCHRFVTIVLHGQQWDVVVAYKIDSHCWLCFWKLLHPPTHRIYIFRTNQL